MITIQNGNPDKLLLIKEVNMVNFKKALDANYGNNYLAIGLPQKSSAKERKEIIQDIKESITAPYKVVLCADPDMFKTLTKLKTSNKDGIGCDTELGTTFLIPNWAAISYNPAQRPRLDFIMDRVKEYLNTGIATVIGSNVVTSSTIGTLKEVNKYPDLFKELLKHDALTIDIETTSLHHYNGIITTIAFSWDKHSGIAIEVSDDITVKAMLRHFFLKYTGTKIFHNASFDTMFLIYHCFMTGLEDWEGMLEGLHCIFNNLEDTRIISYLALNSCNQISLGLKDLAHEYAGDYGIFSNGNTEHTLEELLPYNLIDTCATWFVYEKYKPMMIQDQQEEIYKSLLLPSLKTLTETQLVGFRLNPEKVNDLTNFLYTEQYTYETALKTNTLVKLFEERLRYDLVAQYNATHKKKRKTILDFTEWSFNFNSDIQLSKFLYEYLKLPIIDTTKSGAPAVGADTLEKLMNHTKDTDVINALKALHKLSKVNKIISAFLGNFTNAPNVGNCKGLYGSFNLCGTKSGRLSSSNPNLQQMPSTGSPYAKPVKKIFTAPTGYVFCGADERSLEDRISALTTKDTQKLLVYTDGFDGHCLRSFAYYKEQMPDIAKKMDYANRNCKYYKVTLDDGTEEYLCEEDPRFKELCSKSS